jgi:hypothetical protein
MYTTPAPRVRDEPRAYGPHEVEGDAFPAAMVLHDLALATDGDVPRILARYAALRCWLLRDLPAEAGFVSHAERTARAYLSATPDWPERAPLERLLEPEPELAAARDAGLAAAAGGHAEGAYAIYRAGYLAARRRSELQWAARLAEEIASLLRAEGHDGAPLWSRRAKRLRRYAAD